MNTLYFIGLLILLASVAASFLLIWELLRQNGRMLIRFEALEKRLEEKTENGEQKAEQEPATHNWDDRANRFTNRSLANSKIKRDGLRAGTVAPDFRLPRLDGGELALSELRGRVVLLVFSSPHCGPCNVMAPKLQKFHRKHPNLELVMISREPQEENRAKIREHGLTFPVVLQKQWEVSRDYAYFATPVAYLINEAGVTAAGVAVGVDAILDLMKSAKPMLRHDRRTAKKNLLKTLGWLDCFLRTGRT